MPFMQGFVIGAANELGRRQQLYDAAAVAAQARLETYKYKADLDNATSTSKAQAKMDLLNMQIKAMNDIDKPQDQQQTPSATEDTMGVGQGAPGVEGGTGGTGVQGGTVTEGHTPQSMYEDMRANPDKWIKRARMGALFSGSNTESAAISAASSLANMNYSYGRETRAQASEQRTAEKNIKETTEAIHTLSPTEGETFTKIFDAKEKQSDGKAYAVSFLHPEESGIQINSSQYRADKQKIFNTYKYTANASRLPDGSSKVDVNSNIIVDNLMGITRAGNTIQYFYENKNNPKVQTIGAKKVPIAITEYEESIRNLYDALGKDGGLTSDALAKLDSPYIDEGGHLTTKYSKTQAHTLLNRVLGRDQPQQDQGQGAPAQEPAPKEDKASGKIMYYKGKPVRVVGTNPDGTVQIEPVDNAQ